MVCGETKGNALLLFFFPEKSHHLDLCMRGYVSVRSWHVNCIFACSVDLNTESTDHYQWLFLFSVLETEACNDSVHSGNALGFIA